jgi:hypothetical protein
MFGGGWTTRAPLVDVVQCANRCNRRAMLEAPPMRGARKGVKEVVLARPRRRGATLLELFEETATPIRVTKQEFAAL